MSCPATEDEFIKVAEVIEREKALQLKKHEYPPFDKLFWPFIYNENDYSIYLEAKLISKWITRWALIKTNLNIDLIHLTSGKSNKDLIESGQSPFNHELDVDPIELHHMQQKYEAPFVELTPDEHRRKGNDPKLHQSPSPSWRKERKKVNAFNNERTAHWQARLKELLLHG